MPRIYSFHYFSSLSSNITQATSHSYGTRQNSTLRNFVLPGPIVIKLSVIDYVDDPYSYANFGWICFGGELPFFRAH